MTWTSEGRRIFWDNRGDAVDTVCQRCFDTIPKDELKHKGRQYLDFVDAAHVYMTASMEVDSPLHCDWCGIPIKCILTSDGIGGVLQSLREFLYENTVAGGLYGTLRKPGLDMYRKIEDRGILGVAWYVGSPEYSVLLDRATELLWYGLDGDDERTLTTFIDTIIELQKSWQYKWYFRLQRWADATYRPVARWLDGRYNKTMQDIENMGKNILEE